jgi:sugar/nucleoside kinase (ribokinase family)
MLGNIHPELQLQVLDQITKPQLVVADTMNLWIETGRQALSQLLKRIDVLVINDEEARQFSEEQNLVKAAKSIRAQGPSTLIIKKGAKSIRDQGPSTLIIKKGEHGAMLFTDEQTFSLPALPLDTVADPTGAGDTFAGGFVGYLARKQLRSNAALRKAIVYGSTLSSYCVEGIGTKALESIRVEDIHRRSKGFVDLVDFPKEFDPL